VQVQKKAVLGRAGDVTGVAVAARWAGRDPARARDQAALAIPLALGAVLIVALVLRIIGIAYDYPFLLEVDETRVYQATVRMMAAHSLDPHFYAYGPLLVYIEALWLLPYVLARGLLGHSAVPTVTYYGSGMAATSDPLMHVYGRVPFALLGVGAVWLAFLVARRLGGPWAGLLAASLLALSPLHIAQSHYVLPNAPTGFFTLLTVWGTLCYLAAPREAAVSTVRAAGWRGWLTHRLGGEPSGLILAAVAAALGAAIKYNAVVVLLIPLFAVVLRRRLDGVRAVVRSCLHACVVAAVIFLIVTPPAWSNPVAFVHGAGYELKHYAVIGGSGSEGGPSIVWYGRYLVEQEGLLVFPLAVIGLAVLAWRRRQQIDLLLLVAIAAYYLLIGAQKVHFERNLLVILPLLSVACAYVLGRLARVQWPLGLVIVAVLAAVALVSLARGSVDQARAFATTPAPLVVRSWLQEHLPRGASLIADGYTVPPLDRPDVATTYIDNVRLTPDQLRDRGIRFVALAKSLGYYEGDPRRLSSSHATMTSVYGDGGIMVFAVVNRSARRIDAPGVERKG